MAVAPPPPISDESDLDALVGEARARQRRRRLAAVGVLVTVAGLGVVVYAITVWAAGPHIAGGPIPVAAATACAGPVTSVGHTETVNNTRPLGAAGWIGGIVVDEGYGATKTVIQPNWHAHLARVILRGWRCSDGRPLRFWFSPRNPQLPFSGRGSVEQLASTGSKRLTLRLAYLRWQHFDTVGYVLFSSPGKWVIEARSPSRVLGTVLFDFPH
jgi:hypothetical protein